VSTRVHLTRRGRVLVALVSIGVLAGGGWAATTHWSDGRAPEAAPLAEVAVPSEPGSPSPSPTPTPTPPPRAERAAAKDGQWYVGDDLGTTVVAAVRGMLATAPVVVVADPDVLTPARGVAWRLRAPLLPVDAAGLPALLDDLATTTVVQVRAASHADATEASPTPTPDLLGDDRALVEVTVDGTHVDRTALADLVVPEPPRDGDARPVVLVRPDDPARPLLDTVAMAADVGLLPVGGELVASPDAVARLRATDAPWVVLGTTAAWEAVDPEVLAWDVAVVRSGAEVPGGGLRLFPGRVLVAMYGSPGAASLGILGEQDVAASVERAHALAAEYAPFSDGPAVPTFEIITTVASGGPEPTGDYSRRVPHDVIEPWIDAAGEAGIQVILDLQSGRTDFLTQAKEVEPLLRHPHVGLALDPEWRLQPDQVHLRQIGSVEVAEVQAVADWLAELTREAELPQKLLLLHQFQLRMLPGIAELRVPPELGVAIQMDGQGSQPAKDETWRAITTTELPADVWFGWKNFHDEDTTLRSPADTMAVEPTPVLVSHQ
jgi:hypothetical protein